MLRHEALNLCRVLEAHNTLGQEALDKTGSDFLWSDLIDRPNQFDERDRLNHEHDGIEKSVLVNTR